jgi:prolipoprotein diacylglyceryltransferase
MLNVGFVVGLALALLGLFWWGVRHLPGERWQMIAAVPVAKGADGSWRGLNLTFYGFFSATGTTFGAMLFLLLLASFDVPVVLSILLVAFILCVSVPASRLIAAAVERKRNTFSVAGAAFGTTLLLPLLVMAVSAVAPRTVRHALPVLPVMAAAVIAYVLGESVGRLACLSFGCCYGVPLREASPSIVRVFRTHPLVIEGPTKKAAYASGLAGEPLVPVQAVTSVVFALTGLAGLGLFLTQSFRLAALVPLVGSCGWRVASEWLRADFRGASRISKYQVMTLVSMLYLGILIMFLPGAHEAIPSIADGLRQIVSVPLVVSAQLLWVALFLYYGMSRVTGSNLTFHVVRERI